MIGELTRQATVFDSLYGAPDIVRDTKEPNNRLWSAHVDSHVARAWIAVFWSADTARIYEMNSIHDAMPRLVRMSKADHVSLSRSRLPGHFGEK
jgi:hypothetical protein